MSFKANTEAEDVAERLLSALSPIAFRKGNGVGVTWEDLRRDTLLRANSHLHTKDVTEKTEFERAHLADVIPKYSAPILERYKVLGGYMSHSEDTVRRVYNKVYGLNFAPSNPARFDGVEDINRLMKVDPNTAHAFRPDEKGFTRWYVVCPDDTEAEPKIINGKAVYPPRVYPDALMPHDLHDSDLVRYQFCNWRIRDIVLSVTGENADTPLKLNDDFGQMLQMFHHKQEAGNIPLSTDEQFGEHLRYNHPTLTEQAINDEKISPEIKQQRILSLTLEREAFHKEQNRNYEKGDPFAEMYAEQGLDIDLSFLNDL